LAACLDWHHADELEVEDNPSVWVPCVSGTGREESKGQCCPYKNTEPPVHLQVDPIRHFAYIMTFFKQPGNCNDTNTISRIVIAFFRNVIVIMAHNQLT
jgi:hypothetical protein